MSQTVTTRGQAVIPAEPDEVRVQIGVESLEQAAADALERTAEKSAELQRIFEELEIPKKARSTSGVSIDEQWEYTDKKQVFRGYRASTQITVRLEDASVLGRLMQEATKRASARIHGPWWQVALNNPARAEACRAAAADARRKAEAYAEALGGRLGAVVAVSEPGTGFRPPPAPQMQAMRTAAPAMAMSAQMDVEEGDLDVWAAVEVSFGFEPA